MSSGLDNMPMSHSNGYNNNTLNNPGMGRPDMGQYDAKSTEKKLSF